jgi:plastocyanin
MKGRSLVVAMAAVALLGVACGGDSGGGDGGGSGGGDGGGSATLTASNFKFSPTSLSVAAGGSVEFTNDDDAPHTFTSEDAGVDQEVAAGETATIDLGDVEAGTYDFVCNFHEDMKGTLEVT